MRFEGARRGDENITVDHVREGGVKQNFTYIFLRNFLNFVSIEFILPATRNSLISVKQSVYSPWTKEPCYLLDGGCCNANAKHKICKNPWNLRITIKLCNRNFLWLLNTNFILKISIYYIAPISVTILD